MTRCHAVFDLATTGAITMEVRGRFTTVGWDSGGAVTLVAAGADARLALEAGLRGVLRLLAPSPPPATGGQLAVPLQGTGADLASLFRDLVADLLAHVLDNDESIDDVALDGVLYRNEEGYRGWGYLYAGARTASPDVTALATVNVSDITVSEDADEGIELRITLRRS